LKYSCPGNQQSLPGSFEKDSVLILSISVIGQKKNSLPTGFVAFEAPDQKNVSKNTDARK
jgi:hypothetical protein